MDSDLGLMCAVALERMAYLEPIRLGRAVRAMLPQSAVKVHDRGHSPDESALLVSVDGHDFAVMAVDARLPEPEFSGAFAESEFWHEASKVMRRHQAFVILSGAVPPDGPVTARAQAAALTRLASVLTELLPVLGVYFRGAHSAVPPQRVRQATGDLFQNKWPADLWMDYAFRGTDSAGALFTGVRSEGARLYLGIELEIPPRSVRDRAEIVRMLFRALSDLLTRGRTIRDGEAVRMDNPREAWHQARFVSHGDFAVMALRELDEPIWGAANVST